MSDMSFMPARPEITRDVRSNDFGVVEKPLSIWTRTFDRSWVRKILVLIVLGVIWEVYARWLNNPLIFPTFTATAGAFGDAVASGELPSAAGYSLQLLLKGYVIGLLLGSLLTAFASVSRAGADLLETMTAMFNPLPSIALLPLAMIWFGLGNAAVIFVLVHAVLWSVALNTHSGFRAVSPTLRMVGQNYALSPAGYVLHILIPAAFPSILTGLKIAWAFAWRTLIAAELISGVSTGSGGIGWFIFQYKNQLDIPQVFAGLLTVILLGLFVDNFVFQAIERRTVRRWGMES
jgi:NitT/TauT family transport system permease protein